MSCDTCKMCSRIVDTDFDGDAYRVETEDCEIIELDYCLCPSCREDYKGLLELKEKVSDFTNDIFDWVSLLGEIPMLEHLRQLKDKIDTVTNPNGEVRT